MTRRKFSREFKVEAVKLVTERGVAVAQAARDLDMAESVLRRWMCELTAAPAAAFPGNGQMRADQAEIAALKKEVARLRAERDILKKATAFFSREATGGSPSSPGIVTCGRSAGSARCWRFRVRASTLGSTVRPAPARSRMRSSSQPSTRASGPAIGPMALAASGVTCSRTDLPAVYIGSSG